MHFVTTADGWRLARAPYPPLGASRRRFPVLLCHGLGANRCSFDLGSDPSLAVYLARLGFDVWCLELRGHGRSDRPGLFSPRHFGWSFDDYLHIDLPTAIAKVQKITGTPQTSRRRSQYGRHAVPLSLWDGVRDPQRDRYRRKYGFPQHRQRLCPSAQREMAGPRFACHPRWAADPHGIPLHGAHQKPPRGVQPVG